MVDTMDFIFKTPEQFGLRGDAELWEWLKESYRIRQRETSFGSILNIIDMVKRDLMAFGIDVDDRSGRDNQLYIKAFDKSCKGAGISLIWWRESGFPMIKERAEYIYGKWESFSSKEVQENVKKLFDKGSLKIRN